MIWGSEFDGFGFELDDVGQDAKELASGVGGFAIGIVVFQDTLFVVLSIFLEMLLD